MGVNFNKMSFQDKILLFIEMLCYLIVIGVISFLIITVKNHLVVESGILFFSSLGLIMCGLDAKSVRDITLFEFKAKIKLKNLNKVNHQNI